MVQQVKDYAEKARRKPLRLEWRTQTEECALKKEASPRQVKSLRSRAAMRA